MLICRVFDVLYSTVFQQCKIKTAKQKTASLMLAVLMLKRSVSPQGFCGIAAARRQQRKTPLVNKKTQALCLRF